MVVARRDVGRQRPQRVERRFVAPLELFGHVLGNHMHRHVARTFAHHLHSARPSALRQFALRF